MKAHLVISVAMNADEMCLMSLAAPGSGQQDVQELRAGPRSVLEGARWPRH